MIRDRQQALDHVWDWFVVRSMPRCMGTNGDLGTCANTGPDGSRCAAACLHPGDPDEVLGGIGFDSVATENQLEFLVACGFPARPSPTFGSCATCRRVTTNVCRRAGRSGTSCAIV